MMVLEEVEKFEQTLTEKEAAAIIQLLFSYGVLDELPPGIEAKIFNENISSREKLSEVPLKRLNDCVERLGHERAALRTQALQLLYAEAEKRKLLHSTAKDVAKILGDEEEIKLKGFLLKVRVPSEQRLKQYRTEKIASLEIDFKEVYSFFDSQLRNKFKSLRRKVYQIVNVHAIKIQQIDNQALYLLPTTEISRFMEEINKVNKEFEELADRIVKEYEELSKNKKLMEWLARKKMTLKQPKTDDLFVTYELAPVSISTETLRQALGETLGGELDRKTQLLLEEYERQLRKKNTALLVSLENELLTKLRSLLRRIAELLSNGKKDRRVLRKIQQDLNLLARKAKGCGLEQLAQVTKVSAEAVKAIMEGKPDQKQSFANQLAVLVKIPRPTNPNEVDAVLCQASEKLAGVADARILALKRRMMTA